MRTKGKITGWNENKSFGFITPASGAKEVFFHVNAFRSGGQRPQIGEFVSFVLSTDKQGRPCAVRVARAGDVVAGEIKPNDRILYVSLAFAFLGLVALLTVSGTLQPAILVVYIIASVVSYLAYALDKSAAGRGASRISEGTLHTFALFCGWPGAMVAQQLLRHKSVKAEFRRVFWVTVILNCALLAWLCSPSGSALLQNVFAGM